MTPPADYTAQQAQERLGLRGATFWREIWKAVGRKGPDGKPLLTPIRWGKRCFRFDAAQIEQLRREKMIVTPADLARAMDARRGS